MKVTSFYPMYYANDLESTLKHFTEDLGFTVRHHLQQAPGPNLYVLENNGYRVDVFNFISDEVRQKEGFYAIRINVDDIDEAINNYQSWGYKIIVPARSLTKTKFATMEDDNGSRVFLFQHIKADK